MANIKSKTFKVAKEIIENNKIHPDRATRIHIQKCLKGKRALTNILSVKSLEIIQSK